MASLRNLSFVASRGLSGLVRNGRQPSNGLVCRYQPLFNFNAKNSDSAESKPQAGNEQPNAENKTDANQPEVSPELRTLQEDNAKLLDKVKEIDDKFKRALAETENQRIRLQKQIADAKIFAIQNFCKDLLDVADVLTMAVDTANKDQVNSNQDYKQLFEGVQMTEQQLQGVFRRHGLTKVNPVGEKFNPNEHNALFVAEDPSKEPGTVAVVQKIGYKLHDRTIRPAAVGVVKAKDN